MLYIRKLFIYLLEAVFAHHCILPMHSVCNDAVPVSIALWTVVVLGLYIFAAVAFVQMYACGLKQQTLLVSSSTAVNFRFCAENEETEISIGDGAVLVFNEYGVAGHEEFAK